MKKTKCSRVRQWLGLNPQKVEFTNEGNPLNKMIAGSKTNITVPKLLKSVHVMYVMYILCYILLRDKFNIVATFILVAVNATHCTVQILFKIVIRLSRSRFQASDLLYMFVLFSAFSRKYFQLSVTIKFFRI